MTEEAVKVMLDRLRRPFSTYSTEQAKVDVRDAADLIEAQANRIATLETCDEYLAIPVKRELDEAKARIAELELVIRNQVKLIDERDARLAAIEASGFPAPLAELAAKQQPLGDEFAEALADRSSILQRLRDWSADPLCVEAADLDEQVAELVKQRDDARADVERLKAALKVFAKIADFDEHAEPGESVPINVDRCRDARAALASLREKS